MLMNIYKIYNFSVYTTLNLNYLNICLKYINIKKN